MPGPEQFNDRDTYQSLLIDNLRYQFQRQGGGEQSMTIADALGKLAATVKLDSSAQNQHENQQSSCIRDFLTVAEFLAREGRTGIRASGE